MSRRPRPGVLPALALALSVSTAWAQQAPARDIGEAGGPTGTISVRDDATTDRAIRNRIDSILEQVEAFDAVRARVDAGIVTLTGEVTEQASIDRLNALLSRVDGVVAIEDKVALSTDIGLRLESVRARFVQRLAQVVAGLPFMILGLLVGAAIVLIGGWLSRREGALMRLAPNPFIADFLAQSVRLGAWVVALVVALDLMEATALLGTLLGAAGIFGLSLSFAARDTIENFVATILMSLRQPFRPNDLIEINGQRGRVIRMTSRGTTLLTLDGNHIRFPNQVVYKAVLTNFTRNPERRFLVDLAIDPATDLGAARDLALRSLSGMGFVLPRPEPVAWIEGAGPDTVLLRAGGWVSQDGTDFDLARGEAFRLLHQALDRAGHAIPEPVHRLRLEGQEAETAPQPPATTPERGQDRAPDLSPDAAFVQLVERERSLDGRNLLRGADRPAGDGA